MPADKQQFLKAVKMYHNGIICPSEAWHEVKLAMDGDISILDELTDDALARLRQIYTDRPASLENLIDKYGDEDDIFAQIKERLSHVDNL